MAKKSHPRNPSRSADDVLRTAQLIDRCRFGDEEAAQAIFARYLERLTALARTRLSSRLAARFDATDIVMSAYRSFFIGLRDRGFSISNGDDLWQLLVQITLRKLYRQVARHGARKRTTAREVRIHLADGSMLPIPTQEPGPAQAVAVTDELEFVLSQLPALGRHVLELRLQGEGVLEIAAEAKVNERTVRRWLDRARKILESRGEQADAGVKLAKTPRRDLAVSDDQLRDKKKPTRRRKPSAGRRLLDIRQPNVPIPNALPTLDYGDYVLQKMIGAGFSGKVYCALCRCDGKSYALKFLRKQFARDDDAVRRFLAEVSVVAQLDHPNIVSVRGCGRTPVGIYFFAMNLATSDLQQRIHGRVSVSQAIRWVRQAAAGVQFAHQHGIIHRDLKPSNLLVSRDGNVLVPQSFVELPRDEELP